MQRGIGQVVMFCGVESDSTPAEPRKRLAVEAVNLATCEGGDTPADRSSSGFI